MDPLKPPDTLRKTLPDLTGQKSPLVGGRYQILQLLGKGGMGEVYLAEHTAIQKRVALKILTDDHGGGKKSSRRERFLYEARAAARIRHPNVIDITDYGETPNGHVFIVMEYLQGEDLKRFMRRRHVVPWKDAAPILLQICAGLGAAHSAGVIHRDLKPENIILIEQDGRGDVVKILDFGLAKITEEAGTERLTKTGLIVGTPAYLSPEQVRGEQLDARADVYASGIIMYRMLCGSMPFHATSLVTMLRKQLEEVPPRPSEVNPQASIPPAADDVVMMALAKRREGRFASMQDMAAAIAQIAPLGANECSTARAAVPHLAALQPAAWAPDPGAADPVTRAHAATPPYESSWPGDPTAPGESKDTDEREDADGETGDLEVSGNDPTTEDREGLRPPRHAALTWVIVAGFLAAALVALAVASC